MLLPGNAVQDIRESLYRMIVFLQITPILTYHSDRRRSPGARPDAPEIASYYDSFLFPGPRTPSGAPKLMLGFFFILIPPLSKSACTFSSWLISRDSTLVFVLVGESVFEGMSDVLVSCGARVVVAGGASGCSSPLL